MRSRSVKYVYLARMGSYFKIGYSKNPEERLRTMVGVMLPPEYKIALVFSTVRKSARLIENLLHRKFAGNCIAGEWFQLTAVQVGDAIEFMKHGTLETFKCKEWIKTESGVVPAIAECQYCNYKWGPKVPEPRKCPECQRRWPLKGVEVAGSSQIAPRVVLAVKPRTGSLSTARQPLLKPSQRGRK